jgi:hypothetical protein
MCRRIAGFLCDAWCCRSKGIVMFLCATVATGGTSIPDCSYWQLLLLPLRGWQHAFAVSPACRKPL